MVALVRVLVMIVASAVAASVIVQLAHAETPSVRMGPVYAIQEPDMLEEIQSKLQHYKDSGQLEQWQDDPIAKAKKSIAEPKSLALPRAFAARTWLFDPTYTVAQDVRDGKGLTLAKAGDQINPLTRGVTLRQPLVFLDGSDESQVAMAKTWKKQLSIKVILTGGRWQDTAKSLGQQVYFDQRGALVKRFGIQAVPAIVEQDGDQLRVSEIVQ
jgi:conjugal transfer pilus assembly protein TraW